MINTHGNEDNKKEFYGAKNEYAKNYFKSNVFYNRNTGTTGNLQAVKTCTDMMDKYC